MDFLHLSAISAVIGTLAPMLVYTYVYFVYRERYIGIWMIAWWILFCRNIFFDCGMFAWKQSLWAFFFYQILFTSCPLVFLWGTHLFTGRKIHMGWIYAAVGASLLSTLFTLFHAPIIYRLFPPVCFSTIVCLRLAMVFLRLDLPGIGRLITGCAFIVWAIMTSAFPFFLDFFAWFILISCILRLAIATGTLIAHFEKTRADLINKETQYRLLAQNAVDIIYRYRLRPERKFDYISPSVFALTGHRPEEYYADGQLLLNLIHPDDLPLFSDALANRFLTNGLPLAFRLIRKDQTTIRVEQKCVPVYDKQGNVIALEGIIRDVTARWELEQSAVRADKMNMVGQMAVSVAHEIRNPLTTVRGYLQLLGNKEKDKLHKDRYNLLIEELDRTNEIISEYLLLSKDKVADLQTCSLNAIIQGLHPVVQAAALSNINVKLDLQEDIPPLYLDSNEVRQLLFNLVRNSIDAMPAGGEIVIRTRLEQKKVVLAVSDQGDGIPPRVLDHLGTPFLTTKEHGTGLGLPICYSIAHRHNASIYVESSDQGTTFFVNFPIFDS